MIVSDRWTQSLACSLFSDSGGLCTVDTDAKKHHDQTFRLSHKVWLCPPDRVSAKC